MQSLRCNDRGPYHLRRRGPQLILFLLLVLLSTIAPVVVSADSTELRIGQQILQQYQRQGLVLRGTRYNAALEPIATRMKSEGRGLYDEPFNFYVLHKEQPNAFSVPGGFIFVTDGLIDFVKMQDELACVSGHEMAHVIHHDAMNRLKRTQQTNIWLTIGHLILGGNVASIAALALNVQSLHFDRKVETDADFLGADLCARAGFNPYGLVWMMEQFEQQPDRTRTMEMFSDHPREDHRISDLEAHFKSDPTLFAKYSHSTSSGTPLKLP